MLREFQAAVLADIEGLSLKDGSEDQDGIPADHLLDDHLCTLLVSEIPRMVKRCVRLGKITATTPVRPVNVYLREAARAHLVGLNQAQVALARAAVEQAL